MPQCVFLCQACKEEFTQFLHVSELDTREVKCPKCGSSQVERQVAVFSAVTSKKS